MGNQLSDNDLEILRSTAPAELIEIFRSPAENMSRRTTACWLLGERRVIRAVPALIEAAQGRRNELTWAATIALGKIRSKAAIVPLTALAKNRTRFTARQGAIIALGRIGDRRATPVLIE